MDLKEPGNFLYLVGMTRDEMGGSHYYKILIHSPIGKAGSGWPGSPPRSPRGQEDLCRHAPRDPRRTGPRLSRPERRRPGGRRGRDGLCRRLRREYRFAAHAVRRLTPLSLGEGQGVRAWPRGCSASRTRGFFAKCARRMPRRLKRPLPARRSADRRGDRRQPVADTLRQDGNGCEKRFGFLERSLAEAPAMAMTKEDRSVIEQPTITCPPGPGRCGNPGWCT